MTYFRKVCFILEVRPLGHYDKENIIRILEKIPPLSHTAVLYTHSLDLGLFAVNTSLPHWNTTLQYTVSGALRCFPCDDLPDFEQSKSLLYTILSFAEWI